MAGLNIISKGENPTPQMPGALDITKPKLQPGNNVTAAPKIPSAAPPNAQGGKADFSSVTDTINAVVAAKTAQVSAENDAYIANRSIDNQATTQISGFTDGTIKALGNIKKADSLPGGAGGKIARMLSIFDSDYNIEAQKTEVLLNQQRASQITATADNLKNQNNALPTLLSKVSEAENIIWTAQKDANQLAINQQTLNNQVLQTRISAANLRLAQTKEAREATDFRIKGMSTAQIQAELPRAEAGKGPFANQAGLLKERLVNEQTAETSLAKAQIALSKDNRVEYNESSVDAVSHMPRDAVTSILADAQKKGAAMVDFPDGKGGKVQIPFNLVQQGLAKSINDEQQVNSAVAADMSTRLNLVPNVTKLMNVGNAFASVDPRMTALVTNAGHIMSTLNPKDPASIRQVSLAMDDLNKQRGEIVKQNAGKFGTKDAESAVLAFGESGKFDSVGGTAVVADSVGIPSLSTNSKYRKAFDQLRISVAQEVNRQHTFSQAPVSTGSDAQSLLAMFAAKPQGGKDKLNTITQNLLTDPTKVKPFRDSMKGKMQADATFGTISQLAHQKDANPFWLNVLGNVNQFKTDGKFDPAKLFQATEQARVLSHGKMDFSNQFLDGLLNYGQNAENTAASDPNYTIQDRALEAAIFGNSPIQSVVGETHYTLRQLAQKARQEMGKRIEQDVSGHTQQQAMKQAGIIDSFAMGITDPYGQLLPGGAKKLYTKTGIDIDAVPSATGTSLTAAQTAAIFGGGK